MPFAQLHTCLRMNQLKLLTLMRLVHLLHLASFLQQPLLVPCACSLLKSLHHGHLSCFVLHLYPSTVATLSSRKRNRIETAFEHSVEGGRHSPFIGSRLHDFGFRGCTCVEQSVLGGVAHLLNFEGTDTLSAAYYAQVNQSASPQHS